MKKIIITLILCLILTGCSFGGNSEYQAKVKRYQSLIQVILDNDKFQQEPQSFDLEVIMNEESGGYSYDIIIDNPKIAMYSIEVIVVENNQGFNEEKMMVSSGVFENPRSMIPGQVNTEAGFVGGMILNALTPNADVNLKILVTWKDNGLANDFSELIEVNASINQENSSNTEESTDSSDTEESETETEANEN